MSFEKAEESVGALKESNELALYLPSARESTLGGETPPSLIPGNSTMPAMTQDAANLPFDAEGNDPFDTTSSGWTFGGHLAASLESEDLAKRRSPSAEMSVLFDNLRVVGAGSGATYQNNVGEIARAPFNVLQGLFSNRKDPEKTILHGIDGVVRAGEMLLVLGRPGSGCSTLLKNLAGFSEGYVRVEGDIKYNGIDVDMIQRRFRADVVYNAEVEAHFPHLTVGQTLRFAVETRIPAAQRMRSIKGKVNDEDAQMLATTFGLRHTLNTLVGNDFVRGVSGGERKRVSLAEVLATKASVYYWDNPSRGLDASTSLEFATTIRDSTRIAHHTAIVAAYQAGENFTLAFDKVTILYLGRQIFFGTLDGAKSHFEALGFQPKARQTTADFLTAITDPTGRRVKPGWEHKAPRSPDDFVRSWKESKYYTQLRHEMDQYNTEFSAVDDQLLKIKQLQASQKSKHQRANSPYIASIQGQFTSVIKRSFQRVWGNKTYLGATAFSAIFMSLITGSVFVNTPSNTSAFFSKGGVIFFCILFNAVSTLSEVGLQYSQRPIVNKQKGFAMYHPFIDSLASIFAEYPFKIINVVLFDIIIYFIVGLKQEAGAFFIFLLVTFLASIVMSALFRTVAASTKQPEAATALAGVLVLTLVIYTGYVIPVPSMHPWFSWLRYINPVQYGFEALMVNEFHGQEGLCSVLVPSGPGYENISTDNQVCAVTGSKPGLSFVSGDDYLSASFGYEYSHLWRNIGIMIGFWVFFVIACAVATEFNPPSPPKGEFLVFRKGHEPEHVKNALASGKAVDDLEPGRDAEVLTATETRQSEFRGLVKSKDVFTWEHINYDIALRDGTRRRLLNDISGYVKPGTLTALMGESGAGKTTLLNVLAKRVDTGVVTGITSVSGRPSPRSFQRRTGYVQQQDVHIAESTVREALRFSALLRQTSDVPIEEKYEYVERVIEMLEMEDYAEAVIGTPGNGLNVEQRKRTTIGIELVAKPALLLFLDEPTSGLDSQSAWSIVRLLRKLANSGQAILCTIHQPSSVLFEQFDRLLLLKKGGRTVYFGDVGQNSKDIIHYFESQGAFKCQPGDNPAEYILQVIGAGATAKADRDWADVWEQTIDGKAVIEDTMAVKADFASHASQHDEVEVEHAYAVSWLTQYQAVQSRVFQIYWRSPDYIVAKLILNVVAGLFLGFTFYEQDATSTVQGLQNKLFAVFLACILAMPLMNQLLPKWEALASLYSVREKPSKIYGWSIFVLANIVAEIPYNVMTGTLFFIGWYFGVGYSQPFSGSDKNIRGVYQWLMLMSFQMWWSTFGQAMAALSPSAEVAGTFTTLFASFVLTFNGVLQPLSQLVGFWHWMYDISTYTYLIGGLVANSLSGVTVACAQNELNIFNPPAGQTCQSFAGAFVQVSGKLLNPDATSACEYCRYSVGDQYLETKNMSFDNRWRNFGFMCVYIIFNAALCFAFFYLTKVASFNIMGLAAKSGNKTTKTKTESPLTIEPGKLRNDSSDDKAAERV